MVSLLRLRKFSVIIDEATDKSVQKQLAVLATFFDVEKFEAQYWLVDLVETEDGSAGGLYAKMKETFLKHNIPMNNIIGYSSDTTNVMFGQYKYSSILMHSTDCSRANVLFSTCSNQKWKALSSQLPATL